MSKSIQEIVLNDIVEDSTGIYISKDNINFNYTDGVHSEKYLQNVLLNANDLSSNSYELESYIIDWNSEYHLSRKRSQLLKGINFDKNKNVLEVGCGCGAITRFLGETFENVIAIEGSYERAKIAKLRTRDLNNVKILCNPFQDIKFKEKFDLIFCIGVFEYSGIFVKDNDPYNYILNYFSNLLKPGGEVIIAIENQFGLRYFSYSPEDHNNIMFDGLEGYTRFADKNAKTFGYNEIKKMLSNYFLKIQFYFPYPDYKTPSILIDEDFLDNSNTSELLSTFKPTRFLNWPNKLFDENFVLHELEKNQYLKYFSNSFLIIASKNTEINSSMKESAIIFTNERIPEFQTITKIIKDRNNYYSNKFLQSNKEIFSKSGLSNKNSKAPWQQGLSLHAELLKTVKYRYFNLNEAFKICRPWIEFFKLNSVIKNGEYYISGNYLDATWKNTFITNSSVNIIDNEWIWNDTITLKRLLIKSIYEFLNDAIDLKDIHHTFKYKSKKTLISNISQTFQITITNSDIINFINFESDISEIVFNRNKLNTKIDIYCDIYLTNFYRKIYILYKLLIRIKNKLT